LCSHKSLINEKTKKKKIKGKENISKIEKVEKMDKEKISNEKLVKIHFGNRKVIKIEQIEIKKYESDFESESSEEEEEYEEEEGEEDISDCIEELNFDFNMECNEDDGMGEQFNYEISFTKNLSMELGEDLVNLKSYECTLISPFLFRESLLDLFSE
jgi:hypothetical protein